MKAATAAAVGGASYTSTEHVMTFVWREGPCLDGRRRGAGGTPVTDAQDPRSTDTCVMFACKIVNSNALHNYLIQQCLIKKKSWTSIAYNL